MTKTGASSGGKKVLCSNVVVYVLQQFRSQRLVALRTGIVLALDGNFCSYDIVEIICHSEQQKQHLDEHLDEHLNLRLNQGLLSYC